jgi:hypothetical protein
MTRLVFPLLAILACTGLSRGQGGSGDGQRPARSDGAQQAFWLQQLQRFEPLSKTHWFWPLRPEYKWYDQRNRPIALELARICGSWPAICVHRADYQLWEQGIRVAAEAGVPVSAELSPWGRLGGENPDPRRGWQLHVQELQTVGDQLTRAKAMCAARKVAISLVFIDCELFHTTLHPKRANLRGRPEGDYWDGCIAEKLWAIDRTVREIVPGAKVAWYAAPKRSRGPGHLGPQADYYVPSLYHPLDLDEQQRAYWTARAYALLSHPPRVTPVIPCVALGAGKDERSQWQKRLDYPLQNDWELGRWLADAEYLDSVYLYPTACPPGVQPRPQWLGHFVAYACGFSGQPLPNWLANESGSD